MREPIRQLLGQAVAEVLVVAVRCEVEERQHDNRRSRIPFRAAGARAVARLLHGGHHAVSPLGDGLDELRMPDVIAEQLPKFRHRAAQQRLGGKTLVPHVLEDLVLGNHSARVLRQEDQEIHQPRPQMVHFICASEPAEAGLDEPVAKMERPAVCGRVHDRRLYPQP